MPRDRFVTIMCYLHLVDSSLQKKTGEVGYDLLFKVDPLLDRLAAVFLRCRRISSNSYTVLIRTPPFPAKDANFRTLIHSYT